MIIVPMTKNDVGSVLKIEQASFKNPWSRISFLNELAGNYSHNFVLRLENSCETYQIIAYVCFRLIIDELHLLKIAVNPARRRQGLAVNFLNECLKILEPQQIKSAFLEVRQHNVAATGLYTKAGFYIEAQIPDYYSDTREDAILMRKTF